MDKSYAKESTDMGFDAKRAKALAPGDVIIVDEAPGLRLKATASTKTWTYRYKSPVDGKMRQVALGQWPAISYAAALGAWNAARDQRSSGVDLSKERKAERSKSEARARAACGDAYLVSQLIEDYLTGAVERRRLAKGAAEVRRLLTSADISPIAFKYVSDVTRTDTFDLIEAMAARAPVLANSVRQELGAAWEHALDAGRISQETPNWWRQILRGKIRSKGKIVKGKHQGVQYRALDSAEVAKAIRFFPNFTPLINDLLTLYLWTGCRGCELVAMEGREITEESDGVWWTIPREKLKMRRNESLSDLRVPLIGRALSIARRRLELYGKGFLFPARTGDQPHVDQAVLSVAVWTVRPSTVTDLLPANRPLQLDMKSWSPHDLRRTVRTTLASMKCPFDVAEAVIGHLPSGDHGVYNRHHFDAERREWLTKLIERWEGLVRD